MSHFTAKDIEDLFLSLNTPPKRHWVISPRVLRWFRRHDLRMRKMFPAPRRYRKGVHRAYRKIGRFPAQGAR